MNTEDGHEQNGEDTGEYILQVAKEEYINQLDMLVSESYGCISAP